MGALFLCRRETHSCASGGTKFAPHQPRSFTRRTCLWVLKVCKETARIDALLRSGPRCLGFFQVGRIDFGGIVNTADIYGQQTDPWGFSRYSVVVHMPEDLAQRVMDFRAAIGMTDLTSSPHISIVAALYGPTDLEELQARLRVVAAEHDPGRIEYENPSLLRKGKNGWLPVAATQWLMTLRDAVTVACQGVVQFGGDPKTPYRPHVTLYQSATEVEAATAGFLASQYEFAMGFPANTLDLVGRAGPPRGGSRTIIATYPFQQGEMGV